MRVGDAHKYWFDEDDEQYDAEAAEAYFATLKRRQRARHRAQSGQAPFVLADTIANARDLRSLELQTGRRIDTRCELNTYLTETDMRCMEKGDAQHRRDRELQEWLGSGETEDARGPIPDPLQQRWATTDYQAPKDDIIQMYREKKKELNS